MNGPVFRFAAAVVSVWISGESVVPAALGASEPSNLKGLHVALDVGHSKAQGGAISARGRSEFDFNLDMARSIAGALRSSGAKVTIINEKGTMTGLAERPLLAGRIGADAFISIHHDSVNDKYLKTWEVGGKIQRYSDRFIGYSVFCSNKNVKAAQSRQLAIELGNAMLAAGFKPALHHHEPIPGEDRPFIDERTAVYEYTNLAVVKYGALPSALLECGVIVNRDEELKVQTREYQQKVGKAVVSALGAAREKKVVGPAPGIKLFGNLLKSR